MFLKKIPVLIDNYIWILFNTHNFCIIIDPGLSDPVIQEIEKKKWHPIAILLTHNHLDHTGGVKKIVYRYPNITVFGPAEIKKKYVNKIVTEGDKIIILDKTFHVFFTPGHTPGHISYYSKPYLFCGDTLFSGGCGRVYKQKYLEMYCSLKLIKSFPNNTIICCAHEYTLSNLQFSLSILPHDKTIHIFFKRIENLIKLGRSSLPAYIFFEKKINLFLKTNEFSLKKSMGLKESCTDYEVFVKLRLKKDFFIGAKRD
ncbi:hydroxyacylglutathione hydrolase [Buchnera aphidicola (Hyperomyzus lactucae)]|uniref:Hydroxyacylglutathione hydrolase n=1 Tax=Buchnera aphidicola (Hyperomyzus lactucae) TaxID=1241860 RepID=A0A4D6Y4N5_9GAMM|nr:hydroxyacylglutathione hydrolase [Buchnera aphidicola]QCI20970.1 hydroxyacylglutathione hydrolase [Buchnera aphidicola (Hyperomyzus lactucae)]